MSVITIARQFGSLGDEIGRQVAERLGLHLVDGNVISETARGLGLAASDFEDRDEWQGTVVSDLVRTMRHLYPATIAPTVSEEKPELDEARNLEVIRQVIWEVARKDDAVIIGRGASSILGSSPTVLHVLIVAPLMIRAERIMSTENLDHQRAVQRIKQVDERRARYIRRFYGTDWLDVGAYDLVVNTGHFSQLATVELVCNALDPTT